MKYYCINESLNDKITGIYPQVENAQYTCDVWNEPKFVDRVNFIKTDFEPIIANAIIRERATLTDLISAGIVGFSLKLLISGKLKGILESNRNHGLQFYNAPVLYDEGIIKDYWIINPFEINMEYIDFMESEVFLMKNTFNKEERLVIESYDGYMEQKSKIDQKGYPYSILVEKLKLIDDVKEDFFVLLNVEGGIKYVVSEKLKLEIESNECTGIEFMPVELSQNEWLAKEGERERVYGKV